MFKRLFLAIRNLEWKSILIEFIILVLGITIAYQLNIRQEKQGILLDQEQLLFNIYLENQNNLKEYDRLIEYRLELDSVLWVFYKGLKAPDSSKIIQNLPLIMRSSVMGFHQKYLSAYLADKTRHKNPKLTKELILLEEQMAGLEENSNLIFQHKLDHFYDYLKSHIDFYSEEIIHLEAFAKLEFRNEVFLMMELEESLNYQFEDLPILLNNVKTIIESELDKDQIQLAKATDKE